MSIRPNLSMSRLLSSAIGQLSASIAGQQELSPPDSTDDIRHKVASVCRLLKRAPKSARLKHREMIITLIKSLDAGTVHPICALIAKEDQMLMQELQRDPLIRERLAHSMRVAEISQVFSTQNLRQVSGSITTLKRRIFEIDANS